MDGMSIENMELSINLMDTEADIWGICSSPLPIAHEHKMTEVVAHPISVQSMTRQWNNNLQLSLISIAKVSKKNTYNQLKTRHLFVISLLKKTCKRVGTVAYSWRVKSTNRFC